MKKGTLLSLLFLLALSAKAAPPITIIKNDWASQIVFSEVVGRIYKEMGLKVNYMTLNTSEQWGALSRGVANIQLEVWEGTMSDDLNRFSGSNMVEVVKTYKIKTREDWWYPKYVEKLCPGLPDWEALKKCSHIFAPEGKKKGVYFAGPWEKPDEPRVRALGLNFKVEKLKNGEMLKTALLKAVKVKRPIVLFNWTPNWIDAAIPGSFVNFPEYSPECETNPRWGINKDFLHDCGNPKKGWLKVVTSKGMKKKWPCAHKFLQNMEMKTLDLAEMAYSIDLENLSYVGAAKKWLKIHKKRWRSWIPKSCKVQ